MIYLSACAIYKNEGPYLREWVEFHRLVGFERFFLYDNASTDEHREALAPYIEEGIVVLYDWPMFPGQLEAYKDCFARHSEDSRWIACIDLDEFVFSPTFRPVPEIIADYERWPGISVNRVSFGTSGHATKPPGLVLENFLMRTNDPLRNGTFKSIVNPREAYEMKNPETFFYREGGFAVDENEEPTPPNTVAGHFSRKKLRINHYVTKSREEWLSKIAKPTADTGDSRVARVRHFEMLETLLNQERDEIILHYLPALKEALRRTEERSRVG
jgi:hypothetical protein